MKMNKMHVIHMLIWLIYSKNQWIRTSSVLYVNSMGRHRCFWKQYSCDLAIYLMTVLYINFAISARILCMLSPSFGHKKRTMPVLSPSYGNSARNTCMLSPPFGLITTPIGGYVRRSVLPLSNSYYLWDSRHTVRLTVSRMLL